MRRGAKPAKARVSRKLGKNEDSRVRDPEKNLAEALKRETHALEQQTATSEILRIISSSPTDVQPVFDTIAASASRLCGGVAAIVTRFDGEMIHLVAHHNPRPGIVPVTAGLYPRRPSRDSTTGRAILECSIVHIPDAEKDPDLAPNLARDVRAGRFLAVPMLRDGRPIGAISVSSAETGTFPAGHIELLKTFADQAVIAIENVRLFNELQEKNRALTQAHAQVTESLEQQTATGEILRVISSSPTDVGPVFAAVATSAARLCDAFDAAIHRIDGDVLRLVAHEGPIQPDAVLPLAQGTFAGHVVRERRAMHVADLQAEADVYPVSSEFARNRGFRTILGVPLLRGTEVLGTITIRRSEVRLFTDRQAELLKTFADQAVIAIENVRLFNETKEALEQQTATSEILRAISSSPTDLQPVLDALAERAARLCSADDVKIHLVDGDTLRLAAQRGPIPSVQTRPIIPTRLTGRTVLERRTIHVHDMRAALDEFPDAAAEVLGHGVRTSLSTPLRREDVAIGVIQMRRLEVAPFSEKQITLLQTFADQAVIAIENVRLFRELEARNRDLTEALEQRTATADVLRIIAQSPTELQPVLDAIAASAVRLCEASDAVIERLEGDRFYNAAHAGAQMKGLVGLPLPLTRRFPGGRAVLDRQRVILDDIHLVAEQEYPDTLELLKLNTIHSVAEIPLLSEGKPLGSLAVLRAEVRPFTDAEIALLETFADQAVIAIENVRLFRELEARNRDVTEALEQQTATGEILRVIASSPTDLQPVLDALVASASRLCQAADTFLLLVEGDQLRAAALHGSVDENARLSNTINRGWVAGRAIVDARTVHVEDLANAEAEFPIGAAIAIRLGHRTALAIPLLRKGVPIGALFLRRQEVRQFSNEEIALLQTFADQAVIAIENVRLFRELEQKSRELETASQHKSEFLANMSHELRTPLNAIIGFSEVLSERMFGDLNEKQEEYLKDIYASGTHLLSLINDILDLSKIEAGRMELELTDFDLPTAIDSALTLVRERAGRRSITLEAAVDQQLGEVRADERKIRQVILNLLSNAIKFTPEGGRIEVRGVRVDGFVEVSVSDTGVGIAPEDQEAVFEEFRQVGTSAAKQEGTGLGLALCRKFVELHGGRIRVHSEVGAGSTFTFTIPARHDA